MGERNLRQSQILDLIRSHNGATINELKSEFSVSAVTIRKDLEELERDGLIIRRFGGAMPAQTIDPLESFNVRSRLNKREKQCIGQLAATLIQPMESVIIDAGSTALEIIRHLPHGMQITIITPAINLSLEACAQPNLTVFLPGGGLLDRFTFSLGGKDIEDSFARLHADKLFLGIRGLDLQHGLTDTDTRRITLKPIMIQAAREVIVVADSRKIGKPSLFEVAPLEAVHTLVTDEGIDPATADALTKRNIRVLIARDAE